MTAPTLAPVSITSLLNVFHNMTHRVSYHLGAKADTDGQTLACDSHDISEIDCSGFTRYALAKATGQQIILPDGSQAQLDFCRRANLHKLAQYSDVKAASYDAMRLFIAFLSPAPGADWPRHVWMVRQGWTLESCGSQGVTARIWNDRNLRACVDCFELPTVR